MPWPMLGRDAIPDCYVILHIQKKTTVFFKKFHWSKFYRNAKETKPMNSPEPQGEEVDICIFVDSGHAGDKVFPKSRSGFLL